MFKNVIVGVKDGDAALDALALARVLAGSVGQLTVVHVEVDVLRDGTDLAPEAPLPKPLLALPDGANGARHPLTVVTASSPAAALHAYANRAGADLLVVGASTRRGLQRARVRGTTNAVLDDPPCAVAVAPVRYAGRAGVVHTIGVGYDGSLASERALDMARTLAEEGNAKLMAFEAIPPQVFSPQPFFPADEVKRRVAAAEERLDDLRGVEGDAEYGPVHRTLGKFGERVDLLVLGPHEHEDVPSPGATLSQRLAGDPPCPLLVLPMPRHPTS